MAWKLSAANLPEAAKGYLSVLGGCGDEAKAREECGVTKAEVARWARDDEFVEHRSKALEYHASWRRWTPAYWASPARFQGENGIPPRKGFVSVEDMSPQEVAVVRAQQRVPERQPEGPLKPPRPGEPSFDGGFSDRPSWATSPADLARWGVK